MRVKILGTRNLTATTRDLLSRVVRPHTPLEQVQRQQIPYWQQQGWTRTGNEYHGSYRTRRRTVPGFVEAASISLLHVHSTRRAQAAFALGMFCWRA
jgi:hypothetical protein